MLLTVPFKGEHMIDFAALKATPIESVLRQLGISARRQGNMLVCKCPLPSHTSTESNSFKASLIENLWTCHSASCRAGKKKGGDVIDLVREMTGCDVKAAAERLGGIQNAPKSERSLPKVETNGDLTNNKPLAFSLQANPEHPMIQDRGISVATAKSYGVGYYRSKQGTASMDDRIIFPLVEAGGVVGYLGRATLPDQLPKWKLPPNLVKSMCFGLERCDVNSPLILVESPWAVLYFRGRGMNAAALLGKELTAGQEKSLEPYKEIKVCLDNDEAGREAANKIVSRLKVNHSVTKAFLKE